MFLRRSSTVKYFVAGLVGAVIYCEWFIYISQPFHWRELDCSDKDATCTKILFIADPQIQGDLAVPPPLSYLFNWDSDRYLKSTFSVVVKHFKPDVLVFMGDLMDEGSIATMPQYHSYVKRLSNIFEVDYPIVQIWIPGDNDIGGENEPIKKDKVAEFEKVFVQPPVIHFRNMSFYKVNGITHHYPNMVKGKEQDNFKIVVSHYPVTNKHVFGHQVNEELHPNIYFCAHDHESKYVKQKKDLTNRETVKWLLPDHEILNINFNEDALYEVYVPTCSYRMGTSSIGYGAAVIENNRENMRYLVIWSPTRFPYLFLYLAIVVICIVYFLTFWAAKLFHKTTQQIAKGSKIPLMERI